MCIVYNSERSGIAQGGCRVRSSSLAPLTQPGPVITGPLPGTGGLRAGSRLPLRSCPSPHSPQGSPSTSSRRGCRPCPSRTARQCSRTPSGRRVSGLCTKASPPPQTCQVAAGQVLHAPSPPGSWHHQHLRWCLRDRSFCFLGIRGAQSIVWCEHQKHTRPWAGTAVPVMTGSRTRAPRLNSIPCDPHPRAPVLETRGLPRRGGPSRSSVVTGKTSNRQRDRHQHR